jgi:UDP-N-acetylglucosamine--N-acetylmuramyl-(pentapeptide) pyrophosphoryl-undecaprenol N-acetylglucosamine transferase
MSQKTIILAAGGTGGHIFPAEALADCLIKQGHKVYLFTDSRYVKRATTPDKMEIINISAAPTGGGIKKKLISIISILKGVFQARKKIKKLKPDVVVGFGGYPSFPTMYAAVYSKVKTVIHEQNSVLGRVNKMLSSNVDIIATSFAQIKGIKEKNHNKVVLTGNPVRSSIKSIREFPYNGVHEGEHLHIVVIGGSQGATVLSEVVPKAILALPTEMQKMIRLDQQCRKEDLEMVRSVYEESQVNVDLATFFDDMPSRLASAHLIIARSGASTIAELTVSGRPSILIPYMYATDDHQTQNALSLEKKNAAVVLRQKDITPEAMSRTIKGFIENPDSLKQMAVNAFEMGKPDAVERLARVVLE